MEEKSIELKGMEPKLYNAALNGSIEDISIISNWKKQATPMAMGINILHIHIGKPLYDILSEDTRKKVSIEFIEEVLNDEQGTIPSCYLLLRKENNNGDTPLHLAARFGYHKAVQLFLERAKEVNQEEVTRMLRKTNNNKDTALHEAARGSHAAVVKLLVEADSSCPHEANEVGETPLYLAAERGSTASVAIILETCHPSSLGYSHKGPCGRTPLHAAVQWGNPEMVRKMLEKETSLIRIQDDEGLTPLHSAAAEISKFQLLKVLLHYDNKETETSVLYIRDKKGRTPLHIAILRCNWEAIKKLTKCGPDYIEIVDNHRRNVVYYAAKWGCLYKLKTCLKKGHFDNHLNDKDVDENTPLHLFAASIPNLGHACLLTLPCFIRSNYQFLDLQAFNEQNLTIGGIFASKFHMLHPGRSNIQRLRSLITSKGKRVNAYENDVDIEKANSNADSKLVSLRKAAQGQSLVATLIATVSFAAGFTLPGGFNQNPRENIGMAVLKSKAAFKIFLISDALAFTCPTLAILMYFILVTTESVVDFLVNKVHKEMEMKLLDKSSMRERDHFPKSIIPTLYYNRVSQKLLRIYNEEQLQ